MAVATEAAASYPDCKVVRFEHRLDLIRHLLSREAVDLVVIDTETDHEAVSRLAAWRACHGRRDFAVMLIAQALPIAELTRLFAVGCDDLLVGAFNAHELYARATHCVRRATQRRETFIELGGYTLDKDAMRVTAGGQEVSLTAREFSMAWLFFLNPGVLLTRPRITAEVWGRTEISRTLARQIHNLRQKMALDEGGTMALKAVYSEGYRLEAHTPAPRGYVHQGLMAS